MHQLHLHAGLCDSPFSNTRQLLDLRHDFGYLKLQPLRRKCETRHSRLKQERWSTAWKGQPTHRTKWKLHPFFFFFRGNWLCKDVLQFNLHWWQHANSATAQTDRQRENDDQTSDIIKRIHCFFKPFFNYFFCYQCSAWYLSEKEGLPSDAHLVGHTHLNIIEQLSLPASDVWQLIPLLQGQILRNWNTWWRKHSTH